LLFAAGQVEDRHDDWSDHTHPRDRAVSASVMQPTRGAVTVGGAVHDYLTATRRGKADRHPAPA
jgi:hypothetical protein